MTARSESNGRSSSRGGDAAANRAAETGNRKPQTANCQPRAARRHRAQTAQMHVVFDTQALHARIDPAVLPPGRCGGTGPSYSCDAAFDGLMASTPPTYIQRKP